MFVSDVKIEMPLGGGGGGGLALPLEVFPFRR